MISMDFILKLDQFLGYFIVSVVSIVSFHVFSYFHSFFFYWPRYHQLKPVTTKDIKELSDIPFLKVQITTKGLQDSNEGIIRGIKYVLDLVLEDPEFYKDKISIEVVTESEAQKEYLGSFFYHQPIYIQLFFLVVPVEYTTTRGTLLKARTLHYMTEQRRQGFNRRPFQTFIIYYDEDSAMVPNELRKLIRFLAMTDKKLLEGPIHYPLQYDNADVLCQTMEDNRPIAEFEYRRFMDWGIPFSLHGSNLVIAEELESELGWDIGNLKSEALIAEDYIFGMIAYLRCGSRIFGWHGCIMYEQPPLLFYDAFKQRFRWVIGVLQGIVLLQQMTEFRLQSKFIQFLLIGAVRYRILTFILIVPALVADLFYLLFQIGLVLSGQNLLQMSLPVRSWLWLVNFLWLNVPFVGSWYNHSIKRYRFRYTRWIEIARVLATASLAGMMESIIALFAVVRWTLGKRKVFWRPTPKKRKTDSQKKGTNGIKELIKALMKSLVYIFVAVLTILFFLVIPLINILKTILHNDFLSILIALTVIFLSELVICRILIKTVRGQL